MKTRKFLSMAMALVMAMGLAVPAFADETANQTIINAMYEEIEINVEVPSEVSASINPYGLPVDVYKSTKYDENGNLIAGSAADGTITGQPITTQPAAIINRSAVSLDVSATSVAEAQGEVKLGTAKTLTDGDTYKTVAAWIELVVDKSLSDTSKTKLLTSDNVLDAFITAGVWDNAVQGQVMTAKGVTDSNLITLAKGDGDVANENGVALFRIGGVAVQAPKSAWAETDGVKITIQWTFSPAAEVEEEVVENNG